MENKKIIFLLITIIVLVVSCPSGPKTVPAQTATVEESFDSRTISSEQRNSTMAEVQLFMEELNRAISNRNYNAWRADLSDEYFAEISSPGNLRRISEEPAMKTRNIVLRTAQDYFTNVVVPSRANSRVDEIEFIARNRVKAYTVSTNGQKLRLYDLEKIGNSWKIIN